MPQSPLPIPLADTTIVTAFKAGDVSAFQQLYRAWYPELTVYAGAVTTYYDTDASAHDSVQDVFWSMWNARSKLPVRTVEEFRRYLFVAVRRRVLADERRARKEQQWARETVDDINDDPRSIDPADLQDTLAAVQRAIHDLPPRSREVLVLRWQHGMDLHAVAEVLGISYGSVRVLHSRALAALRERLEGQE